MPYRKNTSGISQRFADGWERKRVDKSIVLQYKAHLLQNLAPASVNSVLSSLNSFFAFYGYDEPKAKMLKMQKRIFADRSKELTKEEYMRLLNAAQSHGNERLYYLMQTICASGIRVSELQYITVEALKEEQAKPLKKDVSKQ